VGNLGGKYPIFTPIHTPVLYSHYGRKKFTFYDNDGNLVCNPIMYMMALAFADNAFENNFTRPEEIYSLVVPPESDRIRLRWKDPWPETPIFRDVEHTANGIRVSQTKSLEYGKHWSHWVRLGRYRLLVYFITISILHKCGG